MTGNHLYRFLLVLAPFAIGPLVSMGYDGSPHSPFHLKREIVIQALRDSLPENKKTPEEKNNMDNTQVIKEVPKSHKQIKPITIPAATQIKPIKVLKPKVLKPAVRIHLN
jgi:hypothetical protein